MQIEKALINDRLRVSNVSWKFCIPTIVNFAVIHPWNLPFFKKVAYFLTVSIAFSIYKQNFTAQCKNECENFIVSYLCRSDHKFIIIWLLYDLHNCTFKVGTDVIHQSGTKVIALKHLESNGAFLNLISKQNCSFKQPDMRI